jgi:hypothetical protein
MIIEKTGRDKERGEARKVGYRLEVRTNAEQPARKVGISSEPCCLQQIYGHFMPK